MGCNLCNTPLKNNSDCVAICLDCLKEVEKERDRVKQVIPGVPLDKIVIFPDGLTVKDALSKFEELRQGFASVLSCEEISLVTRVSTESYHEYTNMICVELGGESVETIKVRI